ncbi:uncharacterized protein BXZ73DRAFT_40907 [Epithele typhae]|uniref:uncharacterized protein n=1 Tax=Epithele typhae TaxID=378194 RepID=UPI002008A63C|nr:uncharacterized protein BXZ73DRAFT_40907 [Epithele typhae]KAH9942436.1 hypothetical protein BXZ73DRAFT_40907 [Epithele typhae]
MNPPHILIARNSRGLNTHNPSASLSSPTETHAAAAGIFRSAGSPSWYLEECESDEMASSLSTNGDMDNPIEIHETFTRTSKFPGNVKIIVESTTFWAHKEVLYFASAFFQAALCGGWAETENESGRPQSVSSVITISQPPTVPGSRTTLECQSEITFAPVDPDVDPDDFNLDIDLESDNISEVSLDDKAKAREDSLSKLEKTGPSTPTSPVTPEKAKAKAPDVDQTAGPVTPTSARIVKKGEEKGKGKERPDAIIVLKEEKASTFHDFLKFVYPHIVCTITWNNVEGLMNISHKLHVSSLQTECLTFLLTHAAGRPIKAMRIAELFDEEELYRESSRFVLDNPGGWSEEEMSALSQATLLKLEKRRTWFLERVLKLGLVQIAKEYQCCPTCPDSAVCARLLEEKWKQAYQAVFRFGPCQPSMVYRYLRTLEGVSPPLSLTHLSCQTTAKAFVSALFDRMFSLGVRGSGTDTAPLGARVAAVAGSAPSGPRRHFLFCSLHNEPTTRGKRSREQT